MKVLIFGTFDRLHPGHEFFIREAMKRGDLMIIVARDRNVERIKGSPPEESEGGRVCALKERFPTAQVLLGDPDDFLVPVRELHPDRILLGYDQKLPPGVTVEDLPCPLERLSAFHPEKFKSSLRKEKGMS